MAKKRPATERLAELERQREQLARDIKQARKDAQAERQQNATRRKILLGALLVKMVERGDVGQELFEQRLDQHLTRPADRKLFELDSTDNKDNQGNPPARQPTHATDASGGRA